jgi:SpoVK/Ycf46/Vps4 family AAA+-type ATPase
VLREQQQLEKLKSHGLRPRQTLLLTGPPGCGKTLTATAIAGELGVPLFIVRLEGLITRYLGETAAKLRLIFDAVERTRAVYLFDEFDSIGIARGSENDVGEMRRVLNAFLVFVENHRGNSVIIAATNHGHLLDRALYRRFDDLIELGLPGVELAERTFRERLAGQKNSRLKFSKLAEAAEGLSYAEITRVCEESIKDMLLHDKKTLSTGDVLRVISERRLFLDRQP